MNDLIAAAGVALTIALLGGLVMGLAVLVFLVPDFKVFMQTPDTQLSDAYLRKYPEAFAH